MDLLDKIRAFDIEIEEMRFGLELRSKQRSLLIIAAKEAGVLENDRYRLVTPTKRRRTIITEVLETKYPEVFDACKSIKVSVTMAKVEKWFGKSGVPPECVNVDISEGEPVLEVIGE